MYTYIFLHTLNIHILWAYMMRVVHIYTYFHVYDVYIHIPPYIIHTYIMGLHDACVTHIHIFSYT